MRREPAEQRQRELNRKTIAPLGSPFEAKVVGVSFAPEYPAHLYALDEVWQEASSTVCGECRGGAGFVSRYESGWEGERCEICNGTRKRDPEPLPAILVRNPANTYDPNAVQVHVPALGNDGYIGYLTAPIVARMAPEIDAGVVWAAEVINVLIDANHLDRPGISIKCYRVEARDAAPAG